MLSQKRVNLKNALLITATAILGVGLVGFTVGTVVAETAEDEPNDDFDTAQDISEGEIAGEIIDGESDFYRLEANTTDALDVEATADSGDIDLRIFDSNRDEVVSATGFASDKRVTAKVPETGTFFIEVAGKQARTTTEYTLRVDKVTPTENDQFAPNDGFESAAAIEDQFSNAKIWGGESDFYRVGLNAGEGLEVEATADSGDIDLRIFDPDREEIKSATGFSGNKNLMIRATDTGNYFVEVAGKQRQTTTAYELQSNQTGSFDVPSVSDYADSDGVVTTDGLREAIDDWRSDDIGTSLLRDVIDAWRSGDPVG
ncbi:MAG: PPC domain-containing protein [Halovenus sp.]